MPVRVDILASGGVVYVRFDGVVRMDEIGRSMRAYGSHPDFRPGQKQLVDLSRVTGIALDHTGIMSLMAEGMGTLVQPGQEMLLVFWAPTREGQAAARMVTRSWDGNAGVVTRVVTDEAEALAILGLQTTSIAALLAEVP